MITSIALIIIGGAYPETLGALTTLGIIGIVINSLAIIVKGIAAIAKAVNS